ncbi:MAG: dTDP-4-dehydrorhamnose 3,5-epimerase [Lachnospiraceae bacterium]|nr:dTDP-4-dehydrorhamnose 3,5-epimerase [Lachnospiraceae bacterium]
MGKFTFHETPIEGLYVVEPTVFADQRGYFLETYNDEFAPYVKHLDGTPCQYVQDNESRSQKGVLRGLHMQLTQPQGKLVRVLQGEVYDVAVDARKGSPTYGQHLGVVLSEENKKQLLIPEGFLHGFAVLSETATFAYKCTRLYAPGDEFGIMWNDKELNIPWPVTEEEAILAEKDKKNHDFSELTEVLGR